MTKEAPKDGPLYLALSNFLPSLSISTAWDHAESENKGWIAVLIRGRSEEVQNAAVDHWYGV